MANDTVITVIGNLTADPELRFTPGGDAVANFTIASTPRMFDRQANDWKEGETLFLRSSVWRDAAENVAETLTKGMRVIAQGRLKSRSFETKEGEKRTVTELDVDEVGPALRWASAKVTRTQRGNGQQQGGNGYQGAPQGGAAQPGGWGNQGPQNGAQQGGGNQDPWQSSGQGQQGGGWNQPAMGNFGGQQQPQQGGGWNQGGGFAGPGQQNQNDDPPF
ncbi:single-stranded DNA-binding protein [Arthrobacter rhombi]|uniref:single-stranded DNA-binding protein n=1 Tax=Arthrobacter rhombi TaxID=71253 RepID=UPI003FD35A4D